MPLDNLLAVSLVTGLFGLVILFALWPGERQGERLLRRWGISEPTGEDIATAVAYLRRRRFWYPWLFIAIPAVLEAVNGPGAGRTGWWQLPSTLLLGALIAEVLAQRPVRQPRREALLSVRRLGDLIPRWALTLAIVAGIAVLGRLAAEAQWVALGWAAGALVAASLVVALAVRRPASGRVEVDLALRTRSARVAASLGPTVAALIPGSQSATWTAWIGWAAALFALGVLALLTAGKRAAVVG